MHHPEQFRMTAMPPVNTTLKQCADHILMAGKWVSTSDSVHYAFLMRAHAGLLTTGAWGQEGMTGEPNEKTRVSRPQPMIGQAIFSWQSDALSKPDPCLVRDSLPVPAAIPAPSMGDIPYACGLYW
jgi:hypothetical protein